MSFISSSQEAGENTLEKEIHINGEREREGERESEREREREVYIYVAISKHTLINDKQYEDSLNQL